MTEILQLLKNKLLPMKDHYRLLTVSKREIGNQYFVTKCWQVLEKKVFSSTPT